MFSAWTFDNSSRRVLSFYILPASLIPGRRSWAGSLGGSSTMPIFTELAGATAAAKALAPTACTTIEEIGSTGIGGLTLGFLALTVTTVVMVAKAANADPERRKYYFCNTFICGIATFAYFSMLSGQGWTAISGCRQFFYAHYIDWLLTTPLIILNLGDLLGITFFTRHRV
jgi:bacteriorhodopsin